MPNVKSAKKRVKTNRRDQLKNKAAKSTLRTILKSARQAVDAGEEAAKGLVVEAQSFVARMAKRGIVHKRKAARVQSRLMKRATRAGSSGKA